MYQWVLSYLQWDARLITYSCAIMSKTGLCERNGHLKQMTATVYTMTSRNLWSCYSFLLETRVYSCIDNFWDTDSVQCVSAVIVTRSVEGEWVCIERWMKWVNESAEQSDWRKYPSANHIIQLAQTAPNTSHISPLRHMLMSFAGSSCFIIAIYYKRQQDGIHQSITAWHLASGLINRGVCFLCIVQDCLFSSEWLEFDLLREQALISNKAACAEEKKKVRKPSPHPCVVGCKSHQSIGIPSPRLQNTIRLLPWSFTSSLSSFILVWTKGKALWLVKASYTLCMFVDEISRVGHGPGSCRRHTSKQTISNANNHYIF